jgi:hypothetical protein
MTCEACGFGAECCEAPKAWRISVEDEPGRPWRVLGVVVYNLAEDPSGYHFAPIVHPPQYSGMRFTMCGVY